MMCCNYVHAIYPCTIVFLILIIFWICKRLKKIYAHFISFLLVCVCVVEWGTKICAFAVTHLYCCTRLIAIKVR
jgi:uncharacterized membrane protein